MAEIEISMIEQGCLSHPVGDVITLRQRVEAVEAERISQRRTIPGHSPQHTPAPSCMIFTPTSRPKWTEH